MRPQGESTRNHAGVLAVAGGVLPNSELSGNQLFPAALIVPGMFLTGSSRKMPC